MHRNPGPPQRRILLAAVVPRDAFVRGVVRYGKERNWQLVMDMLYTGTFPRGWTGDGILALPSYNADLAQFVSTSTLPRVVVGFTDEIIAAPRIEPDTMEIGRLAARHLQDPEVRSYAWAPFLNDRPNRELLAGFDAELRVQGRTCGILPPLHRRIGPYWHDDWNARKRLLVQQLAGLARPIAVFAANDCVAADVADACGQAGLCIPDHVRILGVGNDRRICESLSPSLSSIDHDVEAMAYRAAELLDAVLDGGGVPHDTVRLPPGAIVVRTSTRATIPAEAAIRRAQAYISDHYANPLFSVSSVADAVGLSRRQLERDFRQAAGCTVRDFIERARMSEAMRLLRDHPRTKISTIADLVGLPEPGTFIRTFRRHFGTTPSAFRWSTASAPHVGGDPASVDSARRWSPLTTPTLGTHAGGPLVQIG